MKTSNVLKKLDLIDKRQIFVLCLIWEILIFWLDYVTDPLLSFTPFYFAPIALSAWTLEKKWAYIMPLVAWIGSVYVYTKVFSGGRVFLIFWEVFADAVVFFSGVFLIRRLRAMFDMLSDRAHTDYLTKANSRWYFYEMGNIALSRSYRYKQPISLAFIDVDNFKEINDSQGHGVGDRLLLTVATTLKAGLRGGDILGRMGGDEFAVLLYQADQEQAKVVVGRMRENLLEAIRLYKSNVTFSIGVVTYQADKPVKIEQLIADADKAMYSVKQASKDGIHFVFA